MNDMRVGAMFYYRTNRDQIGLRNTAVPTSAYTPFTVTVPNGPGGTLTNPKPTTATVYNLQPAFNGLQNNVLDNQPYLDTAYNGVEFTANKRFSHRWQMVAGLTIGKNTGGLNGSGGQSTGAGRPQRSELPDLRQRHRRQRLGSGVPPVGQLPAAVGHQPGGDPGLEPRLSVRVDLLGDARAGDGCRRGADPRQPDRSAERSRRRTAESGQSGRPAHLARVPFREPPPDRAADRHLQPDQLERGCDSETTTSEVRAQRLRPQRVASPIGRPILTSLSLSTGDPTFTSAPEVSVSGPHSRKHATVSSTWRSALICRWCTACSSTFRSSRIF